MIKDPEIGGIDLRQQRLDRLRVVDHIHVHVQRIPERDNRVPARMKIRDPRIEPVAACGQKRIGNFLHFEEILIGL